MSSSEPNTVSTLLKGFKKDYGEGIYHKGSELLDGPRIPTGVFALDLALGGGLPKGKISTIFGPEDSGKSLLAYKIIATYQKLNPTEKCVLVDIEHNFEKGWAEQIGIDTEKLIVISPDYAEQAVDIIEALLYAEDIGLVVIDSIGALVSMRETDRSAEVQNVGGVSMPVSVLARKATLALSQCGRKHNRSPTLIGVNQVRTKIGVMFGNPENEPGGNAWKFANSCRIRLYGKGIIDKKVHQAIPVRMETNFIIKKYKFPIAGQNGVYQIVTFPHNGKVVGECHDWNMISKYLQDAKLLVKSKGQKWTCLGEEYKTLSEINDRMKTEIEFDMALKEAVVSFVMGGYESFSSA